MRLSKRIIAKEFLIFLSSSLLIGIIFITVSLVKSHVEGNTEIYRTEINETQRNISRLPVSTLQKELLREKLFLFMDREFDLKSSGDSTVNLLWGKLEHLAQKDSLIYGFEHNFNPKLISLLNEKGYKDAYHFKYFVESNTLTEDDKRILAVKESLELKTESLGRILKSSQSQLSSYYLQNDFLIHLAIVLFILFYPIRFILLATVWSMKVLNEKKVS